MGRNRVTGILGSGLGGSLSGFGGFVGFGGFGGLGRLIYITRRRQRGRRLIDFVAINRGDLALAHTQRYFGPLLSLRSLIVTIAGSIALTLNRRSFSGGCRFLSLGLKLRVGFWQSLGFSLRFRFRLGFGLGVSLGLSIGLSIGLSVGLSVGLDFSCSFDLSFGFSLGFLRSSLFARRRVIVVRVGGFRRSGGLGSLRGLSDGGRCGV